MRIEIDYYEVLEVSPKASAEIIKKAYAILAKKYHPDLVADSDKEAATQRMALLNEAYEVLSNQDLRKLYDNLRKKQQEPFVNHQHEHSNKESQSSQSSNADTKYSYGQQSYRPKPSYSQTENKTNSGINPLKAIFKLILIIVKIGLFLWLGLILVLCFGIMFGDLFRR